MYIRKQKETRFRFGGTLFLCFDQTESSCPSETVHNGQPDAFRRDNLAEDGFHAFLVQTPQDIKKTVCYIGGRAERTDIMRIAGSQQGDMFRKTEHAAFFSD